jgi:uncharacterized membrane protein
MTWKERSLFGVAIFGLLVSGYLLYSYTAGGPIVCGVGHGCDTVRASEYASFLGLPTPLFGVIFYLLLGMAVTLRKRWAVQVLASVGILVSAYLTYLEAFVIEAWCLWCVVSALLTLVAGVLAFKK